MNLVKTVGLTALLLVTPSFAIAPHRTAPNNWEKHPSKWNHVSGREYNTTWHSNVTTGNDTFEQLIDHNNPGLGTFSQFYYWSTEYWAGPGSPVVLFTPGEVNATGYTSYLGTNRTTGVVAKEIGAAVIVIEHRYWGTSSPFDDLTTKNLQYLTLENSISDLVRFAEHATLPFDPKHTSKPSEAPWLLMGGSYSGALSSWSEMPDQCLSCYQLINGEIGLHQLSLELSGHITHRLLLLRLSEVNKNGKTFPAPSN